MLILAASSGRSASASWTKSCSGRWVVEIFASGPSYSAHPATAASPSHPLSSHVRNRELRGVYISEAHGRNHAAPGAERTLEQSLDRIERCAAVSADQADELSDALTENGSRERL
jgi:hypothetical protein